MLNDEPTIPPRQPNTPRTFLKRGLAFAKAHPDWLLVFALGVLAGWVVL